MDDATALAPLKNAYFILRHGESEANVAQIITSDPAICAQKYGLTVQGKKQVAVSVKKAKSSGWLDSQTLIFHSDFKRAAETAVIAQEILGVRKIQPCQALRERFFGEYDGKHTDKYIAIWANDHEKIDQQNKGVESPKKMLERLMRFMKELETAYEYKTFLLVSHGDPLAVLQAAFAGLSPDQGNLLSYIQPGEVRELTLTAN